LQQHAKPHETFEDYVKKHLEGREFMSVQEFNWYWLEWKEKYADVPDKGDPYSAVYNMFVDEQLDTINNDDPEECYDIDDTWFAGDK
jgi:hypothetical protein